MTVEKLDFLFPFIVFGYGFIVTFILSNPYLLKILVQWAPNLQWGPSLDHLKSKRPFGLICLVIGALWSLQNIWFKNQL